MNDPNKNFKNNEKVPKCISNMIFLNRFILSFVHDKRYRLFDARLFLSRLFC